MLYHTYCSLQTPATVSKPKILFETLVCSFIHFGVMFQNHPLEVFLPLRLKFLLDYLEQSGSAAKNMFLFAVGFIIHRPRRYSCRLSCLRQCLEEVLQRYPCFVLATGGSLVSEPGMFERLLSSCFTVWVRTSPEEHMERVIAQGDMRPMANNRDAMSDLKRILTEREVLYSKADIQIDTAGRTFEESLDMLIQALRETPIRDSLAPVIASL